MDVDDDNRRVEIVRIVPGVTTGKTSFADASSGDYAVETYLNASGAWTLSLWRLMGDWRFGSPIEGEELVIPLKDARHVATALLRAVYHEMPSTWHLAQGDPQEYIAHIAEAIRAEGICDDPHDTLKNVFALINDRRRVYGLLGKEKRKGNRWRRRYEHAARWARRNQKRIELQRKQLSILNEKVAKGEKR